nr:MAG TPA: hypothetical protein [Caudoviricetes sp.]
MSNDVAMLRQTFDHHVPIQLHEDFTTVNRPR